MEVQFDKYQGAGNDFVILDNRSEKYSSLTTSQIAFLCDRFKGIGADGLILINADTAADFQMQYFNSDGNESTLCGNGGRCAVAFAHLKNIITESTVFSAIDGMHSATYINPLEVHLEMRDVAEFKQQSGAVILNTGSPHYIKFVEDVDALNVNKEGAAIRYSESFMPEGINVNFVEQKDATHYKIRTYERGVEGETLACGTGAVAAALGIHYTRQSISEKEFHLAAVGGDLKVSFEVNEGIYRNIFLKGPATYVFSGTIEL